ncbi:vesicular glutamate transporter 2.2-like [Chelonus insularis]|uniref:vesicular glutamate transporter 2.2-like n=1 Tax=Chelonus insularis TaxID=460826 RepID=UPI001588A97C|nr:vesicular glutamate transporter 2.2-like [Chelonus insularis]
MKEENVDDKKHSIHLESMQKQNSNKILKDYKVGWKFWKKRRYVVALLSFLGFFSSYILRVNLSIAIVNMTNGTAEKEAEFDWDSKLQGVVLSSFFYGFVSTQLLSGWLSARVGGKRVFAVGIAVTAVFTIITPPLVRLSVYAFILIRIVEGIFEGITVPSIHAIWANWAPPLERSKLASISFAGIYVGTVFAMPTCGMMAERLGWSSVFYFCGTVGLSWCFLWCYFVTDRPEDDRRISTAELEYIQQHLGLNKQKVITHPWKEIFTSASVWAIVAAHFSENWGFYTMLTQLPKFINDVLNFQLEKTGFFSAIPYLAMAIILPTFGFLADYLRSKKILTTTQVRKLCTCVAFLIQTVFMICAAFTETAFAAITCLTLAVGIGGVAGAGFSVNHLDIAPRHASVLFGISNTFGTLPGILSPIITGYIVQNGTAAEWRIVLIIAGVVYIFGALVYGLLASGEKQKWADYTTNKSLHAHSNLAFDVDIIHERYKALNV